MSKNKEEILADFQSITAIDDVGEAFSHLEESNWDLMAAIQRVIPQDSVSSIASTSTDIPMLIPINNIPIRSSNEWISPSFYSVATTSTGGGIIDLTSDINLGTQSNDCACFAFRIHNNQRDYCITMSGNSTVGDLKNKIYSATRIPTCRQAIRGWPPAKQTEALCTQTLLKNLDLSGETELILIDLTDEGIMEDESNEIVRRLGENFTLNITQQPEGKVICLKFPGDKTILDVKNDVYTITNIQVRYQNWSGWPLGVENSTTLAQSGIDLEHNLTLEYENRNIIRLNRNSNGLVNVETDSSADEFEDASDFNADDDFFSDSPAQPKLKYLIADNIDDETVGTLQFLENYIQRYGEPHPVFFQGSLEDALKEACHKPAKERKLLAIYLHDDSSVLTNVFCDQLLRCESVMQTLEQNFILYGWDLTHESNKNLFLSSISVCVGVTASITVRNIPIDRLPAIIIVGKSRSTCEVLSVINGNVGVDDLLSRLMETIELYTEQTRIEIREENERAAREQVKYEQDIAYQQTLEADMAKDAARKQQEIALKAERKRIESIEAEELAIREATRQEAERCLLEEPDVSIADGVTKIRIRKPTGDFIERRFFTKSKLKDLINFVTSQGYPISEYKIISSWPRRDLVTIDSDNTFESLKLCPQETVFLEER